jgi:hypothetical protein
VWLLTAVTPVVAGLCMARVVSAATTWPGRLRTTAVAAGIAAVLGAVFAWQGGGAIGSGRLTAFGASPWRFGLAVGAALAVGAGASLAALAALGWWRRRSTEAPTTIRTTLAAVRAKAGRSDTAEGPDAAEENKLAG